MRLVKKSTVVWFCETSFKRLSNDRKFRVRGPTPHSPNRKTVVDTVECNETLDVGNRTIVSRNYVSFDPQGVDYIYTYITNTGSLKQRKNFYGTMA